MTRLSLTGISAAICFVLAGCAMTPSAPVVTEVKIPVPVPCKAPAIERPAFAVDALPIGAEIWAQMSALRAERRQRQAYELELEAVVRACS